MDSSDCRCCRSLASSGSSTRAWTSYSSVGARRCRSFVQNSRRHGGLWIYAGGSDGNCVHVVDDRRITAHSETRRKHVGEVFWRSKAVKKLILLFIIVACASSYAAAQTASGKRRAVKTGPPNGLFTPAIITGDLVFTSGQIGIDAKTGQLPEGFEGQLE